MCLSTQGNPTGSTNLTREVIPGDALAVNCAYCAQALYPAEKKIGQSGVAECVNKGCPKTEYLVGSGAAYETLRCENCGARDFLTQGGGAVQRLMCHPCGEDISLRRIVGKRV